MDQVLAVIVCLAILLPCALYGISAIRRDREQTTPEPEQAEQGQETPTFEPDPTVTVEQTFTRKVTNVALTWVKQSIGGSDESRQAIDPPRPKPARDPENDWTPPTNLDDLPDLSDWDVEVNVDRAAPEPAPPVPPAAKALVIEQGPRDRMRDMLGDRTPPRELPAAQQPRPALGGFDPDDLDTIPNPATIPAVTLPDLPDLPDFDWVTEPDDEPRIHVEHIRTNDQPALAPATDTKTVIPAEEVEIVTPVELQGVDMADAPLVPVGRRSMAHVPTVGGLVGALRTGGFRILLAWLTAFRRANTNDLGNAQHLHRTAVMHAQRARVKLAIATNMVQAVQADGIGPNVVRGCVNTWLQCNREATHAFQVVAATDALVRASGGVPVALKDAIRALDRDHGGMAREVRKMSVAPVRDMTWYGK